jgi:molybdopterin converting factor small subunit
MQVTLEYAAQLKRAAGVGSEILTLGDPSNVQDCIRSAAERHGGALRALLLKADGSLHASILVFVGNEQVRWDDPRELRDSDVVTLLPPISGG